MPVSKKILRPLAYHLGSPDYAFWCPGCKCAHGVWTKDHNPHTNAKWGFNGNMKKPTFTPSILIHPSDNQPQCHTFVTNGRIEFLSDCTHEYAGKIIDMIPF